MSNWQDISTAPKDGTRILLRYWKGGKSSRTLHNGLFIVTEGYWVPARTTTWTDAAGLQHSYTYRNELWVDGLGRLLEDTNAKSSRNNVMHWQPLPEEP